MARPRMRAEALVRWTGHGESPTSSLRTSWRCSWTRPCRPLSSPPCRPPLAGTTNAPSTVRTTDWSRSSSSAAASSRVAVSAGCRRRGSPVGDVLAGTSSSLISSPHHGQQACRLTSTPTAKHSQAPTYVALGQYPEVVLHPRLVASGAHVGPDRLWSRLDDIAPEQQHRAGGEHPDAARRGGGGGSHPVVPRYPAPAATRGAEHRLQGGRRSEAPTPAAWPSRRPSPGACGWWA